MPISLPIVPVPGEMSDSDKPISILPEVKGYIPIDVICIRKHAANLRKAMPSDNSDDRCPCSDFVCRIRIALSGIVQMPSRDDVHRSDNTSQIVKWQERRGQATLSGGG
jgi:hypothetical protein